MFFRSPITGSEFSVDKLNFKKSGVTDACFSFCETGDTFVQNLPTSHHQNRIRSSSLGVAPVSTRPRDDIDPAHAYLKP
jgi:hypothetical protein